MMHAGWTRLARAATSTAGVVAIVAASMIGLNDWADAQAVAAAPHAVHDTPSARLG